MPDVHDLGAVNIKHGICGFTSTLYALDELRPKTKQLIADAAKDARTRLMAEIKTFLVIMKAQGKQEILNEIVELTQSFNGYENWTIEAYINKINSAARPSGVSTPNINFSIAMPPKSLMEYLHTVWEFNPVLDNPLAIHAGSAILGLTRTGGPKNRFKNLAHYVYQTKSGKLMSWGEEFKDLATLNNAKGRNYSVVYRISL